MKQHTKKARIHAYNYIVRCTKTTSNLLLSLLRSALYVAIDKEFEKFLKGLCSDKWQAYHYPVDDIAHVRVYDDLSGCCSHTAPAAERRNPEQSLGSAPEETCRN